MACPLARHACEVPGAAEGTATQGAEKMLECGTTCTAAIVQGRCVCLANVGDSLAVVGREVPLEPAAGGGEADDAEAGCRVASEVVTVRHHGLLASERERIQRDHAATTRVLEVRALGAHRTSPSPPGAARVAEFGGAKQHESRALF